MIQCQFGPLQWMTTNSTNTFILEIDQVSVNFLIRYLADSRSTMLLSMLGVNGCPLWIIQSPFPCLFSSRFRILRYANPVLLFSFFCLRSITVILQKLITVFLSIFQVIEMHFFSIPQIPCSASLFCPLGIVVIPLLSSDPCRFFNIFHESNSLSVGCPGRGRRSPYRVAIKGQGLDGRSIQRMTFDQRNRNRARASPGFGDDNLQVTLPADIPEMVQGFVLVGGIDGQDHTT